MARVRWIEVWTNPTTGGTDLAVLRELDNGVFQVLNPHTDYKLLGEFKTYEKAAELLESEEYELVGRTEIGGLEPTDPAGIKAPAEFHPQ